MSNNSILTDKGKKSVSEKFTGTSDNWKLDSDIGNPKTRAMLSKTFLVIPLLENRQPIKSAVFKGLFELLDGEPETHFYSEK